MAQGIRAAGRGGEAQEGSRGARETHRGAFGQGRPGANVSYYQTHRKNPLWDGSFNRDAWSGLDGTFNLVVPLGPGHLLVQGPSDDYINVPTSHGEMGTSWMPDLPLYPDALAHLDLKPGAATHDIEMRLRHGVTVQGRVIGPDGGPIDEAFAMGRTYTPYNENRFAFMPFNGGGPQLKVRDGRFEIPGCDPGKPATFHFLDVKHQLGATAEISARSPETEPVTVRLQKCGSARVLFKDSTGKPLVNHPADNVSNDMILIITPGADFGARDKTNADMEFQVNLDPGRNRDLRTGPDGRVTFVSLIPRRDLPVPRPRIHGRARQDDRPAGHHRRRREMRNPRVARHGCLTTLERSPDCF